MTLTFWLPDDDGKIIDEDLEFVMTGNPECMMIVKANAKTRVLGTIAEYVIDKWKNHLATSNQLFRVDFATRTNLKGELEMDFFKLSFSTWHSIYFDWRNNSKLERQTKTAAYIRFGNMAGRRIYSQLFVRYSASVPADE